MSRRRHREVSRLLRSLPCRRLPRRHLRDLARSRCRRARPRSRHLSLLHRARLRRLRQRPPHRARPSRRCVRPRRSSNSHRSAPLSANAPVAGRATHPAGASAPIAAVRSIDLTSLPQRHRRVRRPCQHQAREQHRPRRRCPSSTRHLRLRRPSPARAAAVPIPCRCPSASFVEHGWPRDRRRAEARPTGQRPAPRTRHNIRRQTQGRKLGWW